MREVDIAAFFAGACTLHVFILALAVPLLQVGVPASTRNLIRRICELGWMYKKVCDYITTTLDSPTVGLVEQSFCGTLQQELNDYYRLIAYVLFFAMFVLLHCQRLFGVLLRTVYWKHS